MVVIFMLWPRSLLLNLVFALISTWCYASYYSIRGGDVTESCPAATFKPLLLQFDAIFITALVAAFVLVDHNALISLIIVAQSTETVCLHRGEFVANNTVWFQQSTQEPLFLFMRSHKGQLPENCVRFFSVPQRMPRTRTDI